MDIKCPSCKHDNMQGVDRCEYCFYTLMQRDLPRPKKDDQYQNVMMTAPIADLITGVDLLVADTLDPLDKILKILQEQKKSCILIYHDKKLVGIISKRDFLKKAVGKNISSLTAEDIMTRNPEFVRLDAPIAYAVNKMATGSFRHVPVIADDGTPISIVSIKDVLGYLSHRKSV